MSQDPTSNFPKAKSDYVTLSTGQQIEVRELSISQITALVTKSVTVAKNGARIFDAKTHFENKLRAYAMTIHIDGKPFGTFEEWRAAPTSFVEEVRVLVEPILQLEKVWKTADEVETEKND